MGQLVVGLAGGALGFAIGGLPGAAIGFSAGGFIGGLLFPPDPIRIEGPRRGDLKVSSSTYGRPIPEGFGTIRMSGNMIWSSGIREVQTVNEVGGKGGLGGPSQEQVSYTYFADCSFAFANGPAEAILRIWADGKLIHDIRDPNSTNGVLGATTKPGLTLRKYLGTETQLQCPVIEAAEGDANTPAYRGTVYVTFENFELTDFGNRIPQITAEIAFKATATDVGEQGPAPAGVLTGRSGLYPDYKREILWTFDQSGTPPSDENGIRGWSMSTLDEVYTKTATDIGMTETNLSTNDVWIVGKHTGRIYYGHQANDFQIDIIDPDSLTVLGTAGSTGSLDFDHGLYSCDVSQPDIAGLSWFDEVACYASPTTAGETPLKIFLIGHGAVTDGPVVVNVTDPADCKMVTWQNGSLPSTDSVRGVPEPPTLGSGIFWELHHAGGNATATLFKWTIDAGAQLIVDTTSPCNVHTEGVTWASATTFAGTIWNNDADVGSRLVRGPFYDETDDNLVFYQVTNAGSTIWKWDKDSDVVLWTLDVTVGQGNTQNSHTRIRNGRFALSDGSGSGAYVLVDTLDGTLVDSSSNMDAAFSSGTWWNLDTYFWDDTYHCFFSEAQGAGSTDPDLERFCIGRATGLGEGLDSVVGLLSGDNVNGAGLSASQYDVTDLASDTVRGYAISRQMPIAKAIEPLMVGFDFDAAEIDEGISFIKRGNSSVATITQSDIVAAEQIVRETRTQEVELPVSIDLGYIDQAIDYQNNTERAQRFQAPIPTMYSRNSQSLDLGIVFTATEAKEVVERLLYTAWAQRITLAFSLGSNFIKLVPTDVVTLTLDSGTSFTLRITKEDIGINQTQRYEAVVQESVLQVASGTSADTSLGFAEDTLPQSGLARLFLIDAPYLRDVDATSRGSLELKYAMAGYRPNWQSGTLWDSDDGFNYSVVGRVTAAATYGIVTNKLPTGYKNVTDESTTLTVVMVEGTLQSVTNSAFLASEQAAIIGNPLTQNWEYVLFRDASQNADGTWSVSHLIRGRRCTDAPDITENHANGEMFIVANRSYIERILLANSKVDTTRYYRGVGKDTFLEESEIHALACQGRTLMPPRVYQPNAVVDASSNIDITWNRGNRINFELTNSRSWNDGPLDEDSENYAIVVYSSAAGASTRVLTASTESVEYANSTITTDFGSVPAQFTFEVFQISAQVGRGFGTGKVTVTL